MNLEQLTLLGRGGIQCQHYLLVGTLASRGQIIFEFSLYSLCVYPFPTGTPRRIDVDIHVVSTHFFRCNFDGRKEKSTSFPRIFFGVISMVEKSMLFPGTFFGVISMVNPRCFHLLFLMLEKSTLFARTLLDEISTSRNFVVFH